MTIHLGGEEQQFSNVLEMDQIVLPFEWHSFCISINIAKKEAKLFHNGHIQAIQTFEDLDDNTNPESKFMTVGHLGGAKFVGLLVDFEVFGRPLSDEDLLQWTLCNIKVIFFNLLLLLNRSVATLGKRRYVFSAAAL